MADAASPAPGPAPTTPSKDHHYSPLSRIPQNIQEQRELLFALERPLTYTRESWDKYFPYIDNVWCLHNRQDAPENLESGKSQKFWGGCRLHRKWDPQKQSQSQGIRNRHRRETGTCQAKFKLTVLPNGNRILERSSDDPHSHALDYIDSVKRNSGVRSLVLEPFFSAWEPASILAYLRDPEHYLDGKDMLNEAGGKYLERREIMNIFAQNMKKTYPGLDISDVKKEQEKYKSVKMCNFKGCNLAFADNKSLTAHRKSAHVEKKHDHSEKLYTCPNRLCHRRKKSKGFVSFAGLKEHQIRMEHWGNGTYHGEDGPQNCETVMQGDHHEGQGEPGAADDESHIITSHLQHAQNHSHDPHQHQHHIQHNRPSIMQQQLPGPEIPLIPLMHNSVAPMSQNAEQHMLQIDPAMQPPQQQQPPTQHQIHPALQGSMGSNHVQQPSMSGGMAEQLHRQAMLDRYNALQQEMENLRNALFS